MPEGGYERYGLTSNPFRNLTSENLDDIEIYHVNQRVDDALRVVKDEVFEKENRAVIALVGGLGAGKTERLLLAAREANQRGALAVSFDVPATAPWVLRALAEAFDKAAKEGGFSGRIGRPRWLRQVVALERVKETKYDPIRAGKTLATALNECAPALLLLNDLHNLAQTAERDAFAKTLQEMADAIKPGVLIMFGCYPSYLTTLSETHPALVSRINRSFVLVPLSADEAGLLLAKKLLAKRLVEDLDPLYPFDADAVALMNRAAEGNPRRLLRLADLSMEYGVEHRAYRVDAALVEAMVQTRAAAKTAAGGSAAAPASSTPAEELRPGTETASTEGVADRGPLLRRQGRASDNQKGLG